MNPHGLVFFVVSSTTNFQSEHLEPGHRMREVAKFTTFSAFSSSYHRNGARYGRGYY